MQRYRRVTFEVRCQIRAFLDIKISISEIARRLGYHRSTIYREISRNSRSKESYGATSAMGLAHLRFKRCRRKRRMSEEVLANRVSSMLKKEWSPEQIAGRLKCISAQTIYNEIYRNRRSWRKRLRRYGKHRGRGRWKRRTEGPAWRKSIHQRPTYVDKRRELGHWERDTMFAKDRKQLIVCLERKSRYIRVEKVIEPYSQHLTQQTKAMLKNFTVLSFTNDRGNEFMDGDKFDHPVYYCDPHSPHQKGSVENVIGLLRQYIPKGADLETLTEQKIRAIVKKLNHRPRKCLDYKTPHEVFFNETVALGT